MTSKQIFEKLVTAGIDTQYLTISRNEVAIYVTDAAGDRDWDATEALKNRVARALQFGGFRCASGEWILQKNTLDMGDSNDKASRWHY